MRAGVVMQASFWRISAILGVLALFPLSGCKSDGYSDAIVYELRQDPILLNSPEKIIPAGYPFLAKADPPGQLPLMTLANIKDHRNPFYPNLFGPKADEVEKLFIDPRQVSAESKETLRTQLDRMFGKPARPRVAVPGISPDVIEELKLDRTSLEQGSKLYRLHCLLCHGVAGDGRGPTAQWVNPHPRDYRAGLFKFQSTDQAKAGVKLKPSRADLVRTLYYGVEGTSMPAFNLLANEELESLASYVMHLSIRGETEQQSLVALKDQEGGLAKATLDAQIVQSLAANVVRNWKDSQTLLIKPADYLAVKLFKKDEAQLTSEEREKFETEKKNSILRGQALITQNFEQLKKLLPKDQFVALYGSKFSGKSAGEVKQDEYEKQLDVLMKFTGCVTCHMDYGRRAEFKFDEWGTLVKPANWTVPVYRGGRRPIDLYYRIHSGINGSGMVYYGTKDGLSGEQIWDLVNFLQVAPYPAMRNKYGVAID